MKYKEDVRKLWEQGLTVTQISSRLKLSAGTICELLISCELTSRVGTYEGFPDCRTYD